MPLLSLDKHQASLFRTVSVPRTQLNDSRVASRPVLVRRADLGEQFVHGFLVTEPGEDDAPRVEVAASGEGDDTLGELLAGLGTRERGVHFRM